MVTKKLKVYVNKEIVSTGIVLKGNLAILQKVLLKDVKHDNVTVWFKGKIVYSL